MVIHTKQSVSGFIASDPQRSVTEDGRPRFYARFGQQNFRREKDGSFTELEPTFDNLVIRGKLAEHALARFQKGDSFVAEGSVRTYTTQRDGQEVEAQEFVATTIGHSLARTRYDIDRTRRPDRAVQRDAPHREGPHRDAPAFPGPADPAPRRQAPSTPAISR